MSGFTLYELPINTNKRFAGDLWRSQVARRTSKWMERHRLRRLCILRFWYSLCLHLGRYCILVRFEVLKVFTKVKRFLSQCNVVEKAWVSLLQIYSSIILLSIKLKIIFTVYDLLK
jgi:hypothetical protein